MTRETIKTWDEAVEQAIGGMLNAEEDMAPDNPWGHNLARAYLAADKHDGDCTNQAHTCFLCERECWVTRANGALRALIAAGVAFVPREPTEAMIAAAGEAASQSIGSWGEPKVAIPAALSAGEIKPEGE